MTLEIRQNSIPREENERRGQNTSLALDKPKIRSTVRFSIKLILEKWASNWLAYLLAFAWKDELNWFLNRLKPEEKSDLDRLLWEIWIVEDARFFIDLPNYSYIKKFINSKKPLQ